MQKKSSRGFLYRLANQIVALKPVRSQAKASTMNKTPESDAEPTPIQNISALRDNVLIYNDDYESNDKY